MIKLFLLPFLLVATLSHSQTTPVFPYKGGMSQLEKDISTFFAEADDTGRIFFAEIFYSQQGRKIVTHIHGEVSDNATQKLLTSFFDRISVNWKKRAIKKMSVIIPLFVEGFSVDKEAPSDVVNLPLQAAGVSAGFTLRKCLLTKPFLISKTAIHIEMENENESSNLKAVIYENNIRNSN